MKTLPTYDIVIDPEKLDQGVAMISLVDEPAIQVDWIKLANEGAKNLTFKATKDKQLLYGPFLIPDMLIYRFDEQLGEYYVRFRKDQIELIAEKFNNDLNGRNINFQHSSKMVEASVVENWLITDGADKSQNFGFSLPEGTWFGGVKVKDLDFWNSSVKNNEVKGFSVEIKAELEVALHKQNNQNNMTNNEVIVIESDITDSHRISLADAPVVEEQAPVSDAPVTTDVPVAEAPELSTALSADDVNQMIDARFGLLNEELSALKGMLEPILKELADAKEQYSQMETKYNEVNEKLSSIPAVGSIALRAEKPKMANDFERQLARIQEFKKA